MYSSEDFERLSIRYKGEAYPRGESIQMFCHRNNVPYNLFEKWYKDTRHRVVEVAVDGRPSAVEEERPAEAVPASKETVVTTTCAISMTCAASMPGCCLSSASR